MANMRDVAKKAGVSVATVSMVLNDKPNISAKTKEHVLRVIEELDYRPNVHAQRMFTRKNKSIGAVFVSKISYVQYIRVFQGIVSAAMEKGYDVITVPEDDLFSRTSTRSFAWQDVLDGLIALGTSAEPNISDVLKNLDIPCVTCPNPLGFPKSTVTTPDNHQIAKSATEYLIKCGHSKIGFIGPSTRYWFSSQRLKSFMVTLKQYGLSVNQDWVVDTADMFCENGYQAGIRLLKDTELPTAFFAMNDFLAMGMVRAFKEKNVHVPDDISVISCDDIELARFFDPPLTTMRIGWEDIGSESVRVLVEIIENGTLGEEFVLLKGDLVKRASVKKIL